MTQVTNPTVESNPGYGAPPPIPPQYAPVLEMNYPKASLLSRFWAHLVDGFIVGLPLFPGLYLTREKQTVGLGLFLLAIAGIWLVYYGFCKDGMAGGQSYGKRINGLMVVSLVTNLPCTKGKSFLRALSFAIPYVGGLIEIVMVLVTEKGRRLGDRFAGTQVIEVSHYRK